MLTACRTRTHTHARPGTCGCCTRAPSSHLTRRRPVCLQEQHRDARPLQVEYYPPNGTFSLHYFPYYGSKAQVGLQNRLGVSNMLGARQPATLTRAANLADLARPDRAALCRLPHHRPQRPENTQLSRNTQGVSLILVVSECFLILSGNHTPILKHFLQIS